MDVRQIREISYTYLDGRGGAPNPFVTYPWRLDEAAGDTYTKGAKGTLDHFELKKNDAEGRGNDISADVPPNWIWREETRYKSVWTGTKWLNESAVPKKTPGPGATP